jgi:hypothetical protein
MPKERVLKFQATAMKLTKVCYLYRKTHRQTHKGKTEYNVLPSPLERGYKYDIKISYLSFNNSQVLEITHE